MITVDIIRRVKKKLYQGNHFFDEYSYIVHFNLRQLDFTHQANDVHITYMFCAVNELNLL